MKINILGSEYKIEVCDDDPRLGEYCDGMCDGTTKEMLVKSYEKDKNDPSCKRNLQVQIKKNKRHEIIHAFLFESGLAENTTWAQNEEMVDFFAIQAPKMLKTFEEADAL